jgi:hypothetical protein
VAQRVHRDPLGEPGGIRRAAGGMKNLHVDRLVRVAAGKL